MMGYSFALLFVAETGDKTQLMAMTLAHRYRAAPVIGGVFAAFLALNLLAVWAGEAVFRVVPRPMVLLVGGALFVFFAIRAWRDAKADDETIVPLARASSVFVTSFVVIFVAELGDKTQLAMVALAAGSGDPWAVLVGGTAALWGVSLIGVVAGRTLLTRIPRATVHRASALLFLAFGLLAWGLGLGLLDGALSVRI